MSIKIIRECIPRARLEDLAQETYGDMVKGVVDIEKRVVALGGELHADGNRSMDSKDTQLSSRIQNIVNNLIA